MFKSNVPASSDASNIDELCLSNCADATVNALPKVTKLSGNSHTGVSTSNALPNKPAWYILRTTYGQEPKAFDYIIAHGGTAYLPKIATCKTIEGKEQVLESSRIPNIFFAYGTFDEIKSFVYDNVHLPFLRFYYKHHHDGRNTTKEPLIIPEQQLRILRIITEAENRDILLYNEEIHKFKTGQLVKIVDGDFKGVVGRVARFQGQLRVGIIVDDILSNHSIHSQTVS